MGPALLASVFLMSLICQSYLGLFFILENEALNLQNPSYQHHIIRHQPNYHHLRNWRLIVLASSNKSIYISIHKLRFFAMSTCSNPGCSEPGINKCSLCKITPYCGPICQTADWPGHREECPGHLRKMGMAHFEKARGFNRARNFEQTFRFSWRIVLLHSLKPLMKRCY